MNRIPRIETLLGLEQGVLGVQWTLSLKDSKADMPGGRYADISGRQESSNSSLIFSVGYYKTLVGSN